MNSKTFLAACILIISICQAGIAYKMYLRHLERMESLDKIEAQLEKLDANLDRLSKEAAKVERDTKNLSEELREMNVTLHELP